MVGIAVFRGPTRCFERCRTSDRNASTLVVQFVDEALTTLAAELRDVEEIVVDVGPGSFTGVKVGVTLAKVWADAIGAKLFGVTAFDLVSIGEPVSIKIRMDAYAVRTLDRMVALQTESLSLPSLGYGMPGQPDRFPSASAAWEARIHWEETQPTDLVPFYASEPSISSPKKPFVRSSAIDKVLGAET